MKTILHPAAWMFTLSAFAAGLTWLIVGPPDRSVPCVDAELKEGQVCLATVREWDPAEILWVDARPRAEWEKSGKEGSLLFNDDQKEDWNALDQEFMAVQAVEPRENVVIYCNSEACGSSTVVAEHLRQGFGQMLGFKVWVLHGGWKALAAEGLVE